MCVCVCCVVFAVLCVLFCVLCLEHDVPILISYCFVFPCKRDRLYKSMSGSGGGSGDADDDAMHKCE